MRPAATGQQLQAQFQAPSSFPPSTTADQQVLGSFAPSSAPVLQQLAANGSFSQLPLNLLQLISQAPGGLSAPTLNGQPHHQDHMQRQQQQEQVVPPSQHALLSALFAAAASQPSMLDPQHMPPAAAPPPTGSHRHDQQPQPQQAAAPSLAEQVLRALNRRGTSGIDNQQQLLQVIANWPAPNDHPHEGHRSPVGYAAAAASAAAHAAAAVQERASHHSSSTAIEDEYGQQAAVEAAGVLAAAAAAAAMRRFGADVAAGGLVKAEDQEGTRDAGQANGGGRSRVSTAIAPAPDAAAPAGGSAQGLLQAVAVGRSFAMGSDARQMDGGSGGDGDGGSKGGEGDGDNAAPRRSRGRAAGGAGVSGAGGSGTAKRGRSQRQQQEEDEVEDGDGDALDFDEKAFEGEVAALMKLLAAQQRQPGEEGEEGLEEGSRYSSQVRRDVG